MIQQFIKKLVLFASFVAVLNQTGFGAYKLQATSEIYSDLRSDSQAMKIIDALLRDYQLGDSPVCQSGDKEALRWLGKQVRLDPAKVAQIAMLILKRESDMGCKSFVVQFLSGMENTDKGPLVEEIRNQLQQLPRNEDRGIRSDGREFLETSAIVLSRLGAEQDKQTLLSLIEGGPDLFKTRVSKAINELDERLAKEKVKPLWLTTGERLAGIVSFLSRRWTWIIGCGLLFLGACFFLGRSKRSIGGS